MPESDPLNILLAHDRWATNQLLAACDALGDDQFHQRFDIGPGSLHDTFTHIVSAMRTWTDTLAHRDARPRPDSDGQKRTPSQVRELHEAACAELASESRRHPLAEMATRRLKDGREVTMTRGAILTHVATHGMHHRSQALNMLKRLGVKPLPPSSVTEWTWAEGR